MFVGFPGILPGFWHTWISPSEFSGSYLLTLVCSPSPLPGVPPSSFGTEGGLSEEGERLCVFKGVRPLSFVLAASCW